MQIGKLHYSRFSIRRMTDLWGFTMRRITLDKISSSDVHFVTIGIDAQKYARLHLVVFYWYFNRIKGKGQPKKIYIPWLRAVVDGRPQNFFLGVREVRGQSNGKDVAKKFIEVVQVRILTSHHF